MAHVQTRIAALKSGIGESAAITLPASAQDEVEKGRSLRTKSGG
jgi:hypothetical protein